VKLRKTYWVYEVVEGKILIENVGAMHGVYHTGTLPIPPAVEGARQTVSTARCVFVLIQFI
jgi:hypothetical protein